MRRAVDATDVLTSRLDAAVAALRDDPRWQEARRKPLADALRTTTLELAELCDALATTRRYVELLELDQAAASGGYAERALAFATDVCAAIDTIATSPDDVRAVRALLVRALESWEPWLPWNVIYELSDRDNHHELESRFFELAGTWDRCARGIVHRLAQLLRPRVSS